MSMKKGFEEEAAKFCQAVTLLCEVGESIRKHYHYLNDELNELDGIINELIDCDLAQYCEFGM